MRLKHWVLLRKHLAKEFARLDRQEENLLDLAAEGDAPSAKVRDRIKRIGQQRLRLLEQQDKAGNRIAAGRSF